MGDMLETVQVWDSPNTPVEEGKEDVLLRELSKLPIVELWRIQWGLSQSALLQDFPPIPPRWLRSADACSTAKTMMRCYQEDRAPAVLAAVQTLIGGNHQVRPVRFTMIPLRPELDLKPVQGFVKTQRRKLISRIQRPGPILEALQCCRIFNTSEREAIAIYGACKDRNRALVDLLLRKGEEAQKVFYHALGQSEPFLLQELEEDHIRGKNASDSVVIMEMLEFLVTDELKCFQWLVNKYMTAESHSPIGGEQLEHADRRTTWRLLEKLFGSNRAERVAMEILMKIVPMLCLYFQAEAVTSLTYSDIRLETNTPQVEITPEVSEDGSIFRLRCQQPGVFRCSLTGLVLEGFGDVVYEMVPWDVDFLSSKGLQVAGALFRFHLLTGSFQRLHLPHCQLLSDGGRHFLSVAHVTGDCVDFITPGQVTDSHVTVDISGFSCFGLVTPAPSDQIAGLVLIFSQPTNSTLFILLLPRNVCLTQVRKEWKRRIGAEYIEAIPDCELIPNHTYKLIGEPVTVIQPETSKFVNFRDYNNFLPSFQVQLKAGATQVRLQLRSHVAGSRLIGWLFGNKECEVWARVIQLKVKVLDLQEEDMTLQLLQMLNCLGSEDLKTFQRFLSLRTDPISVSRLEAADRARTVDLMVQKYHAEGAKELWFVGLPLHGS
uniref:Uncharacterized protein n=1 Tax=Oreochromis aureus TaxID=47969 RepID=A0A668TK17_OREAU